MRQAIPVMLLIMAVTMSFDTSPRSTIGHKGHGDAWFHKPETRKETILQGEILSKENEKISNAYIYVISGEEETLSLKDGRFTLKTWQPLPIVLNIEHKDFHKQRIVINAIGAAIKIKLTDRKEL